MLYKYLKEFCMQRKKKKQVGTSEMISMNNSRLVASSTKSWLVKSSLLHVIETKALHSQDGNSGANVKCVNIFWVGGDLCVCVALSELLSSV